MSGCIPVAELANVVHSRLALRDYLRLVLGGAWRDKELVAFFSARLDETGTGGESSITTVGGAIATLGQWESLEEKWGAYLSKMGVSSFHGKEFPSHSDYRGWSTLKQERYLSRLGRICDRNTTFRISVVDSCRHQEAHERYEGILSRF